MRSSVLMGLTVAATAQLACGSSREERDEALDGVGPHVRSALLAPGPETFDLKLARAGLALPTFGGLYASGDGEITVVLTNVADVPNAASALAPLLRQLKISHRRLRFVAGEYSFNQLLEWKYVVAQLGIPGLVSLDANEKTNRVEIGVQDVANVDEMILLAHGIPRDACSVKAEEPYVITSKSLKAEWRPARGGVKIENSRNGPCTLGFNAYYGSTIAGFVTNSHCTGKMMDDGVTGEDILQNGEAWFGLDKIGDESYDPRYRGDLYGCPYLRRCRYSDAAFITYTNASLMDYAHIAMPVNRTCTITACPSDAYEYTYYTLSDIRLPIEGEDVAKIGQTSGYTHSTVDGTCSDINQYLPGRVDTGLTLLCQFKVDAYAKTGDSGSPVIDAEGNDLLGILWGAPEEPTSPSFVFSPINGIVSDFGTSLDVCSTCSLEP